jgi:hypothetical protein
MANRLGWRVIKAHNVYLGEIFSKEFKNRTTLTTATSLLVLFTDDGDSNLDERNPGLKKMMGNF